MMTEQTSLMPAASPVALGEASPLPPQTWQRALAAWEIHLQSATTRSTYASAVRAFFTVPGVPEELAALEVAMLDVYGGALRRRADKDAPPAQRLAPATVNLRLAALRSFLGYCRKRKWLSPELTRGAVADALECRRGRVQREYQIVQGDELGRLLDAASAEAYDPLRALALVALALGAGLRVGELVALDVGDLSLDKTRVKVRSGKGSKDRTVPFSQEVHALLVAYLADTGRSLQRTADLTTPLFLSRNHLCGSGRLTTRQARRVIVAAATRAGLDAEKHITPHSLRHSYAIGLLRGDPQTGQPGAPLPAIAKLLGHSSVSVTGRYLNHFEDEELARYTPSLHWKQA